jgi:hypothetical protein
MSRNGGSGILVVAGSSLTIGLASVAHQPSVLSSVVYPITKPVIIYVYESTNKAVKALSENFPHWGKTQDGAIEKEPDTSSTSSKTNGNYPKSLFLIPECKHQENNHVDISEEECKKIYEASLDAVITERQNTNNQASQERLMQVSEEAGKKKQREIEIVVASGTGSLVTIYTVTRIANIAVAESGKNNEIRAN